MKLNRNFATLLSQPWAIRAASMAAMMEAMTYKGQDGDEIVIAPPDEDDDGGYTVQDGIATISISGVIGKKLPRWIAELFGMTDVDDVSAMLKLANGDPEVRGILLDVDSPGGTVAGVPETAQEIRDSGKPVFAYSDGLMASAAYWLASGASGVFASPSALVGSIGVFVPIADMRRMYEMAGIQMEVIKAGDLKAAGYPGTSLTQDQRDDIRRSVEHVYGKFTAFVAAREGDQPVPTEAMRGQDFFADQPEAAGLVDGIATRQEVIQSLREYA